MSIESLEPRQLLSASVDNGQLNITGDDGNNLIFVHQSKKGEITVIEATVSPTTIGTGVAWQRPDSISVPTSTVFKLADVTSILVNAGGGNDVVDVGGSGRHPLGIPSKLNGGGGNDILIGGFAKDEINGEDGNDFLSGRGGNDTLNGDAGNDREYGDRGNDVLNGGDGRDRLWGGSGADHLNGDAGNDFLGGLDHAATDILDGGTNDTPTTNKPGDVALIDPGDSVTNVEKTDTASA